MTTRRDMASAWQRNERLDTSFGTALQKMHTCAGKVVVSGMGKSGHVGRKIAATLASTGTPSFFLHPAEALHRGAAHPFRSSAVNRISWALLQGES